MFRMACAVTATLCLNFASQSVDAQTTVSPDDAADGAALIDQAIQAQRDRLGIPTLPRVTGPLRGNFFYDDRNVNASGADDLPIGGGGGGGGGGEGGGERPDGGATPVQQLLPAGGGGPPLDTGTANFEIFWYQIPLSYNPLGADIPLVVAYHGFGQSAQSVHLNSTVDDEADARGWLYLSVTGIDDQLFGTAAVQENVRAAILWMIANFNVDEDKIYGVGFSLGGGVMANMASRFRDPEDIMFASVASVSGAYDNTASYNLGDPALQAWLEQPFNYGGPPTTVPFSYRRTSALYFDPATYPPIPGTLLGAESMGTGLHTTPVYAVWDIFDGTNGPKQNPQLNIYVESLGGTVDDHPIISGIQPPGNHSWTVLDEVEMFDYFDGKSTDRWPSDVYSLVDRDTAVSFFHFNTEEVEEFGTIEAHANPGLGSLVIANVFNATDVIVDVTEAGLDGIWPLRVTVTNPDIRGIPVVLGGFDLPPSYVLKVSDGTLFEGVETDPVAGTMRLPVPALTMIDVEIHHDPLWSSRLWSDPDPATVGGALTLELDGQTGDNVSILIVSTTELLLDFWGVTKLQANLIPPSFLVVLALDGNGDITIPDSIPNNPAYSGVKMLLQGAQFDAGNNLSSMTNLWTLHVN